MATGRHEIEIWGDGLQTRDYVYVGDVARATLQALGADGGVFNVGTGSETSVVELYEACRRVAGSSLDAEHAPERLGELQRSVLDVSRAEMPVVEASARAVTADDTDPESTRTRASSSERSVP